MRRGRAARRSDEPDAIAAVHLLALRDERLLEVAVERLVAVAVNERDRLAVLTGPAASEHDAVGGREHRLAAGRRDVDALVVGRLARERIGADAEAGVDRAVDRPDRRRGGYELEPARELVLEKREARGHEGTAAREVGRGRGRRAADAAADRVAEARDDREAAGPRLEVGELTGDAVEPLVERLRRGPQPLVLGDRLPVLAVLALGREERPSEGHLGDEQNPDGGGRDGEPAGGDGELAKPRP